MKCNILTIINGDSIENTLYYHNRVSNLDLINSASTQKK